MNGKEDKMKKRKGKSRVGPTPTGDGDDLHEMEEKQLRNNRFVIFLSYMAAIYFLNGCG